MYMERMKTASSTETLMEKEYHFDEGVGVSLDMHIKDLKKKYPAAKVQSRRDRDGFAVIKISNKPNYKYNLENILNYNEEDARVQQAETLEALLQKNMPDDQEGRMQQLNPETIENMIRALSGQPDLSTKINLDYDSRVALRQLAMDRVEGRFKDDVQGFITELNKIDKQSKQGNAYTNEVRNFESPEEQAVQALFNDRERFRDEIELQIRQRINDLTHG